jgi:hypothetical protein
MRHLAILPFLVLAVCSARAAEPRDASWVAERVRDWQPTAKDRSWENIGWARSLTEAVRLGRLHHRPVFLFTHDGRLNVGRC